MLPTVKICYFQTNAVLIKTEGTSWGKVPTQWFVVYMYIAVLCIVYEWFCWLLQIFKTKSEITYFEYAEYFNKC